MNNPSIASSPSPTDPGKAESSLAPRPPKVLEALARSKTVRNYVESFCELTGVSVSLTSASEDEAAVGHCRNPFCVMLEKMPGGVALCRQAHAEAEKRAHESGDSTKVDCPFGLATLAIPIATAGKRVGTILVGEVLLDPPDETALCRQLTEIEGKSVAEGAELVRHWEAYRQSRSLTSQQFQALSKLSEIFAAELAIAAGELAARSTAAEPAGVRRAKRYIEAHIDEKFSLEEVGRAVHISPGYLSKLLKSASGESFVRHVRFLRTRRAQHLLTTSELPITEIALASGFRSLPQFNRTFKVLTGRSPSQYRAAARMDLLP